MAKLLQTNLPFSQGENVSSATFNQLVRVLEINLGSVDPDNTLQLTTAERDTLNFNIGQIIYNTSTTTLQYWDGSTFQNISSTGAVTLNITDSSSNIAIDLFSETLSLLGGTGITSTASGNGVTFAIDSTVATLVGSQTLTNKTIDVDNNTLSNIEVDNFKASAIVTESEGIASNDNDTSLPTSAAVKDFVDSQVDTVDTLSEILAVGNTTGGTDIAVSANDDITFTDSSKAIFGAGSDLKIYHDGSNSFIQDSGTGNLRIAGTQVDILNPDANEFKARFKTDGAVELYHDNVKKFQTNASGIEVIGSATFDNSISIEHSSGFGSIEVGGSSGAFIDLKNPMSDDYDLRLKTTGTGGEIDVLNGELSIKRGSAARITTSASGIDITGSATISGDLTVSGTTTTINTTNLEVKDKNITLNFGAGDTSSNADGAGITIQDAVNSTTDATLLWNASNDVFEFSHGLDFGDNDRIRLGTSQDLQIYHDGSDSYVEDTGTGHLTLKGQDVKIRNASGQLLAQFLEAGAVDIRHAGSAKLTTTSSGVSVTGSISSGNITTSGSSPTYTLQDSDGTNQLSTLAQDGGSFILTARNNTSNGNIIFKGNNGSSVSEYGRFNSSGNFSSEGNVTVGSALKMGSTTVIDSSRNLTNIGSYAGSGSVLVGNTSANFSELTAVGSLELCRTDANGFIDFRSALSEDFDCRIQQSSNGLAFSTGGNGSTATALTLDSSRNATFAGTISSGTITTSGDIAKTSGDLLVDVAGDIRLDADGGDIKFADGGTVISLLSMANSDTTISTNVVNKDIIFKGFQGSGTSVTALTLDMSASGTAKFNSGIHVAGTEIITASRNLTNIGTAQISGTTNIGSTATGLQFIIHATDEYRINGQDSAGNGFNSIHLRADGTDGLFIQKDTNKVGIGTTSPSYLLSLSDSDGADLGFSNSSTLSDGDYLGRIYGTDSSNNFFTGINMFYHDSNDGEMRFRIKTAGTNTDVMTLVDGNVGIGLTSPTTRLDVNGTSKFRDDVLFVGTTADITFDASENRLKFPDTAKASFGTDNDLLIYHDGSSVIEEVGTNNLEIRTNGPDIRMIGGSNELMAKFVKDGAVELYHDNVKRLETTSSGVSMTNGLVVEGTTTFNDDANFAAALQIGGTTVTSTAAEINKLDGFTGTVADLNYAKDLRATGVTATEFDFLDGVTSNIQTQIDAVTTVTINNNADNRIITGSGTANTLNGEANLTFDGATLEVIKDGATAVMKVHEDAGSSTARFHIRRGTVDTFLQHRDSNFEIRTENNISTSNTPAMTIDTGGNIVAGYNLSVSGDLTVSGTTTTINTTNLDVADKNITLNFGSGDTSANADGAGITIQDAVDASTDATLLWDSTNDKFDFSHSIQVPDNANVKVGSAGDLFMVHNGSNSFIQNKVGDFYIENASDDKDIFFRSDDGSGGLATYMTIDGSHSRMTIAKDTLLFDNVELKIGDNSGAGDLKIYHNGTHSILENSTGDLILMNNADDKDILFQSDNGAGGVQTYFFLDGSAEQVVFEKSARFTDNDKAIFGTGSDLEIFHNGTNSVINDAGAGDLVFQSAGSEKARFTSTGFTLQGAYSATGNFNTSLGGYQINGTTVIDSSRNLTNIANADFTAKAFNEVLRPQYNSSLSNTRLINVNTSNSGDYIANVPFGDAWHDIFAFRRFYTWTYETSTDGVNFTSATINENIFDHKDSTNYTPLDGTVKAVRWTVTGVIHSLVRYISLSQGFTSSTPQTSMTVESGDGTTFSTFHATTTFSGSQKVHYFATDTSINNNVLRITLKKTDISNNNEVDISRLCAWSARAGNQGKGKEFHYPFDYTLRTSIDLIDDQRLRLGNSQDLQIYHSSGNNFINAPVGGNLVLQANNVTARSVAQENMITAVANGAVTLHHDNSAKLATTSSGIDVTGNIESTGTINVDTADSTLPNTYFSAERYNDSSGKLIFGVGEASPSGGTTGETFIGNHNRRLHLGSVFDGVNHAPNISIMHMMIDEDGDLYVSQNNTHTQWFQASTRNLTNIGTISSGTITSSGNIDVNSDSGQLQFGADNDMQMFHNGAKGEINIATGNFDIDSAGEITLDADTSGVIRLKDGGTEFGKISQNSNNLRIFSSISDGDILLQGNDGGSTITALQLDMSAGGNATFAGSVTATSLSVSSAFSTTANINISGTSGKYQINSLDVIEYSGGFRVGSVSDDDESLTLVGFGGQPNIVLDDSVIQFKFSTSEKMRLDSSGRLGIGTSSPTQPLTVKADNSSAKSIALISRDANDVAGLQFVKTNGNQNALIDVTGENLRFYTASTEALRIDSSQRVGIGTTAPDVKLRVDHDDNTVAFKVTGGGGGANIAEFVRDVGTSGVSVSVNGSSARPQIKFVKPSNTFAIGVNSSSFEIADNDVLGTNTRLSIDSSGNLGLGTSSPTQELHIQTTNSQVEIVLGSSSQTSSIFNNANAAFGILDGSSERLRVDSSGRLGIGTTSPARLLESNSNASDVPQIRAAYNSTNYLDIKHNLLNAVSSGGNDQLQLQTAGTTGLTIDVNQRVGIGTTAPSRQLTLQNSGNAVASFVSGTSSLVQLALGDTDDDNYAQILLDNSANKLQIQNGGGGAIGNRGITLDSSERVGIATSSPSQTLDVAGNIQATGSRLISAAFDSNHYMRLEGNSSGGVLKGADGGVVTTLVRSYGDSYFNSGGGNFGIGVSNPTVLLDILGTGEVWHRITTSSSNLNGIRLGSSNGTRQNVLYRDRSNDLVYLRSGIDNADIAIIAGGSTNEIMRFDGENSRVGIGTTSPSEALHVVGNILTSGGVKVGDSSADALHFHGILKQGSGSGTTVMDSSRNLTNINNITCSGDVLIAEPNPTLILQDTSDDDDHGIRFRDNGGTDRYSITTLNDNFNFITEGSRSIIFKPAGTTALTLDNTQNATFAGDISTSGNLILTGSANEIIKSNGSIRLNIDSNNDQTDRVFIVSTGNNSELFRIDESANLKLGSSATTVIDSSRNLTNIGTISSGAITSSSTITSQANSAAAGIRIRRTNSATSGARGHIAFMDSDSKVVSSIHSVATGSNNSGDLRFSTSTGESRTNVYDLTPVLTLGTDNNATFAGTIGINTSSPTSKLNIDTGSDQGIAIYRTGTNANFDAIQFRKSNNSDLNARIGFNDTQLRLDGVNDILFGIGSSFTEKMRLNSTGLGIGDTSPLTKLEVAGSIKATNRDTGHTGEAGVTLSYNTSSNIALLETWQSKPLVIDTFNYQQFNIGNTLAMFIDGTNRNVGINTNSPSEKFTVAGNVLVSNADPVLIINDTSGSDNQARVWLRESANFGAQLQYNSNSNEFFHINTLDGGTSTTGLIVDRFSNVTVPNGTFTVGKTSAGKNLQLFVGLDAVTTDDSGLTFTAAGTYSDGRYEHRFRKNDLGGGIPLFVDRTEGTANSHAAIARFGRYTNNTDEFEVYGTMSSDGYRINNTSVIDSSRNLTNIGTIATTDFTTATTAVTVQNKNLTVLGQALNISAPNSAEIKFFQTTSSTTASKGSIQWFDSGSNSCGTINLKANGAENNSGVMEFYVTAETDELGDDPFGINKMMSITENGVQVHGSLSKSSGSFKIDHPLKPDTHDLVHSFVEGPQADNLYRGTIKLEDGKATIDLDEWFGMTPGTFLALNRDIQAFVSNVDDWDPVRAKMMGSQLIIECQNTASKASVSWLVVGERQDKEIYASKLTDDNGKIIVEPLKEVIE